MDSLSDKTSIKMVRKALDALPKGSKALDLAYDGAMQRIDSQLEGYRHLAKQLLGWLTYSERLMSVQEIQTALAIEPGESSLDEDNLSDVTEIVGYCAGLIIVDEETIRLVHYTTQEYFRRNDGKAAVASQQDIAISCLTYLLYEEFGDDWVNDVDSISWNVEVRMQRHPFLIYAARHWASHASVCDQHVVKDLTMSFARHDHKVSSAAQVLLGMDHKRLLWQYFESTKSHSPLTVMHLLAYIGNKAIFSELLNHGFEADYEDSNHRTPLWWATIGDQYAMVKFLLSENRVNVNGAYHSLDDYASEFETPLHVATAHGHTSIVKLLLDCADIDVNSQNSDSETPLYKAACYEHKSIVELLLDCADIDVNSQDLDGETPLYKAALWGYTSIVKLLLDCADVDVNLPNKYSGTPLHGAATTGYTSIVKLLCAHPKVDLDSRDYDGRDIVSLVKKRQEQMVEFRTDEKHDIFILALEECLDIIRAAMDERKSASFAQLAEQSSQP